MPISVWLLWHAELYPGEQLLHVAPITIQFMSNNPHACKLTWRSTNWLKVTDESARVIMPVKLG